MRHPPLTPRTPKPRTHLLRPAVACAAGAALVIGATACGSANATNSSAGGGTLTIQGDTGSPALVENFNPFESATELHGAYLIYAPLEISSPVNGNYTPFLATGFKFTNPTTLVYTLRSGVKWSDGKPFTPADVVFTFDLMKKYPALDGNGVWSQISSVSSSGNTVTFTFSTPNTPFAATIAATPIVPEHIWSKISNPVKFTDTDPVGTGPFKLSKFAPTQYTLTKNPLYWDASSIAPSTVVFPAQSTSQTTNQLEVSEGDFDWAYTYLPDVQKTYVDRDPAHNVYWFPPGGTIGLYLNMTKAPNNNVDFRRGISDALDRTTISQKAVNGYMQQASLSGLILPNLRKWLDPSLPDQGLVTQNKSAAMSAFAAAGYTLKGAKLVNSSGTQASLSVVLPNSFSDWLAAATEIKNELGADGINVSLDLPQYAQYSSQTQAGNFDAAIGGFGGTGSPYLDFNDALNSSYAAPINTPTANNFERFKDPSVDRDLATLAASTSPAAEQQATDQLETTMYNQVPIVLLYYGGSWGLFSTKHFTGWPSDSDPYTLPTNYNNSLLTVVTHLKKA